MTWSRRFRIGSAPFSSWSGVVCKRQMTRHRQMRSKRKQFIVDCNFACPCPLPSWRSLLLQWLIPLCQWWNPWKSRLHKRWGQRSSVCLLPQCMLAPGRRVYFSALIFSRLYGLTCSQTITYFRRNKRDGWSLQLFVCFKIHLSRHFAHVKWQTSQGSYIMVRDLSCQCT
jgi:hypothetical protein